MTIKVTGITQLRKFPNGPDQGYRYLATLPDDSQKWIFHRDLIEQGHGHMIQAYHKGNPQVSVPAPVSKLLNALAREPPPFVQKENSLANEPGPEMMHVPVSGNSVNRRPSLQEELAGLHVHVSQDGGESDNENEGGASVENSPDQWTERGRGETSPDLPGHQHEDSVTATTERREKGKGKEVGSLGVEHGTSSTLFATRSDFSNPAPLPCRYEQNNAITNDNAGLSLCKSSRPQPEPEPMRRLSFSPSSPRIIRTPTTASRSPSPVAMPGEFLFSPDSPLLRKSYTWHKLPRSMSGASRRKSVGVPATAEAPTATGMMKMAGIALEAPTAPTQEKTWSDRSDHTLSIPPPPPPRRQQQQQQRTRPYPPPAPSPPAGGTSSMAHTCTHAPAPRITATTATKTIESPGGDGGDGDANPGQVCLVSYCGEGVNFIRGGLLDLDSSTNNVYSTTYTSMPIRSRNRQKKDNHGNANVNVNVTVAPQGGYGKEEEEKGFNQRIYHGRFPFLARLFRRRHYGPSSS